jgi:arylsulfatase A-like enzyme
LITLDTTRWDHLGVYGYAGGTTPHIDRFARSAVVYDRAYATSSWTLPSHASIFTGLLPMQHGAQSTPNRGNRSLEYGVRSLQETFTTLPELLVTAGYRTGAVVGGPALRREFGLAQGFDTYDDDLSTPRAAVHGRRADEVADAAIRLVEEFGSGPYFLFVNFFDPHAPYRPPAPFDRGLAKPEEIEQAESLVTKLLSGAPAARMDDYSEAERRWLERLLAGYDAEIRYMDSHLGRLLDAIAAVPRGGQTLIAITADHGESFGEHYYLSHGAHLYDDNVRVPLLVQHPQASDSSRVSTAVQNRSLFRTFLAAAEVDLPDGVDPGDLAAPPTDLVLQVQRSDLNVRMFGDSFDRDVIALVAWPFKLISRSTGEVELYDSSGDPFELHDLSGQRPEIARRLGDRLLELRAQNPARFSDDAETDLRPETEESLRALGYLE